MAAVNQLWHRWIYASVAKHLHAAATADGLPLIVEFLDKRGETWEAAASKAEATITGPMTKEVCSGLHRIWVDVFITLTSHLSSNNYVHIDHAGAMAEALDQCVTCKDYGATGLVTIGFLHPKPEQTETIKVVHLKPMAKDTQIHSTIQAKFLGYFSET